MLTQYGYVVRREVHCVGSGLLKCKYAYKDGVVEKVYEKMVGQFGGRYQREGTVGGGNVRPSTNIPMHRPNLKLGLR